MSKNVDLETLAKAMTRVLTEAREMKCRELVSYKQASRMDEETLERAVSSKMASQMGALIQRDMAEHYLGVTRGWDSHPDSPGVFEYRASAVVMRPEDFTALCQICNSLIKRTRKEK